MRQTIISALAALALAACATVPGTDGTAPQPEVAERQPVTAPVVANEEASVAEERQLAVRPVPESKPVAKPMVRTDTRSATKPVARQDATAKPDSAKLAAGVRPVPPVSAGIMKVSMTSGSQPALQGPAWLKSCKSRQNQGDVIMCDSDSLLAHPGDKVLVYTRDARKVGTLPSGGKVVLRESLPSVYRFFVLQ